jgi:hypothetical protein
MSSPLRTVFWAAGVLSVLLLTVPSPWVAGGTACGEQPKAGAAGVAGSDRAAVPGRPVKVAAVLLDRCRAVAG